MNYGCVYTWTTLRNIATLFLRFWQKIIFSDDFDLGGHVNKQNCRIWDTENPHANIEKPTHTKQVSVWCGFWSRGIFGPFFFENEQKEAFTVNGDRFGPCWKNFCSQKLKRRILATFGFNRTAPPATQPKLHSMFCVLFLKIALSAADVVWSPWSFALIPLHYYLWAAVKDKCYAYKPETIDALKDNIREAIDEI